MGKKVVHVEFPAADVDRAKRFWEGVGGWTLQDAGMPGMQYLMFQEGDQGGAVFPKMGDGGTTLYYGSDDIDADLAKVRELGLEALEMYTETKSVLVSTSPKRFNPFAL